MFRKAVYCCFITHCLVIWARGSPLPQPLPPASEPMEEEDRSDTEAEDNLASQTVVQNPELLTATLQTYATRLGSCATQLEMRGLKALMGTVSEKIDRLTKENRTLRVQTPVPATQQLPPPPSTPPQLYACRRGDRSHATRAINPSHGHGARTSP